MRALGFAVKKEEVRKVMADYDREETGKITFDDFVEIMTEKYLARDPEEEIRKAFKYAPAVLMCSRCVCVGVHHNTLPSPLPCRLFDEDGTGRISLKNMRRISRELGENLTDDELAAMIEEFDRCVRYYTHRRPTCHGARHTLLLPNAPPCSDGDGLIDEEDFMRIMKQSSLY